MKNKGQAEVAVVAVIAAVAWIGWQFISSINQFGN